MRKRHHHHARWFHSLTLSLDRRGAQAASNKGLLPLPLSAPRDQRKSALLGVFFFFFPSLTVGRSSPDAVRFFPLAPPPPFCVLVAVEVADIGATSPSLFAPLRVRGPEFKLLLLLSLPTADLQRLKQKGGEGKVSVTGWDAAPCSNDTHTRYSHTKHNDKRWATQSYGVGTAPKVAPAPGEVRSTSALTASIHVSMIS